MKSIDDLMADSRLLTYAMAAFGLDSDARKRRERVREMLEGGVSRSATARPTSLTDKRYANFVAAFDFAANGDADDERATRSRTASRSNSSPDTGLVLVKPSAEYIKAEADYYKANIGKVKSINDLLARPAPAALRHERLRAGRRRRDDPGRSAPCSTAASAIPNSPANMLTDKSYANFVAAFNFVAVWRPDDHARRGARRTTPKLYTMKTKLGLIKPSKYSIACRNRLLPGQRHRAAVDRRSDGRQAPAELCAVRLWSRSRHRNRRRAPPDAGGRRHRSRQPRQQAHRQALCRLRHRLQFRRIRRSGDDAHAGRSSRPSTNTCARRWKRMPARTNEGVRLALYFERKAPTPDQLLRGSGRSRRWPRWCAPRSACPNSFATADIDKQVQFFEASSTSRISPIPRSSANS